MVMQAYVPGVYNSDGTGPAIGWLDAIQAEGAGQMQYIKKAIEDRAGDHFSRVPAQDVLVGDTGTNDFHVVATRDSKGRWLVVYTPTGQPFQVKTSVLKGKIKASWYDPTSGEYTTFNAGSGSTRTFTPPGDSDHKDWALVLETA